MNDEGIRENEVSETTKQKIGQEQIHGLLFGEQLSWQSIIYDLINTEQLDPWDIDIVVLSNKYLEKIREMEEANFFVSSKVLLAAALLLRIKSEILLNEFLPSLDEILFGTKEEKKSIQERLELDEEIPELVPRTPLPRYRRVSLEELMAALGKAIATENRRIKRVVLSRQQEIETAISLPRSKINLKDKIRTVYSQLRTHFKDSEERLAFSKIAGESNEEKIATFIPLLHLDTQHKVLLEQGEHADEIWIWLKELYEIKHAEMLTQLRKEVEEELEKMAKEGNVEEHEPEEDEEIPAPDRNFKSDVEDMEEE